MKSQDVAKMVFFATLFAKWADVCQAETVRSLFNAIRQVETGGHADPANARGDGGRSFGPYQIQRKYWQDSGMPGRYEQVRSWVYAERVMLAYWHRHCPDALARGDFETLARVHNGGPAGHRKLATWSYWLKVRKAMR